MTAAQQIAGLEIVKGIAIKKLQAAAACADQQLARSKGGAAGHRIARQGVFRRDLHFVSVSIESIQFAGRLAAGEHPRPEDHDPVGDGDMPDDAGGLAGSPADDRVAGAVPIPAVGEHRHLVQGDVRQGVCLPAPCQGWRNASAHPRPDQPGRSAR